MMSSSSHNKSEALGCRSGKRSRRWRPSSRKRRPYQQSGGPYYVQHTDKDMLLLIASHSDVEDSVQVMKPSRRSDETEVAIATDSGWGSLMPLEILHRVFQLVVESEGAVPSMCRLSQVCRRWYQVAASPALWHHVSISVCWVLPTKKDPPNVQKKIQQTMEMLIQKRLSLMSVFSLHHWSHHIPFILQNVAASCPHLTSLTLSHCSQVTADGLLSIASQCPQLHSLNLQNSRVESTTVSRVLDVCGARLKSLFLSCSHQINGIMSRFAAEGLLQAISAAFSLGALHWEAGFHSRHEVHPGDWSLLQERFRLLVSREGLPEAGSCPELRVLEVNAAMKEPVTDFHIAIEALQASCPKLEVMRMLNVRWFPKSVSRSSPECPGFTELRELCLASSAYSYISDGICKRLLRDSTNLRVLDARGCYKLTPAGICDFPCTDLERLYLGLYCSSMKPVMPSSGCYQLTRRWQHSLQELDLTAQAYSEEDLAQALDVLSRGGANDTLQSLNLAGTKVTELSVRQILSSCLVLIHLDLSSCRNIPRGMKRVYRGEEDVRQCLSALSTKDMDENGE